MPVHPIDYRYGSDELRKIFDVNNKVKLMAKVEAALAKAQAELGIIPAEAADAIEKAAEQISYEEVKELERLIGHETMALVRVLAEKSGKYGKYVHLGATSNDILDTTMAIQIKEAGCVLLRRSLELLQAVIDRGRELVNLPQLGRTHGMAADPITLGFKMAYWSYMIRNSIERLAEAIKAASKGKMSGAVGTMAAMSLLYDNPAEVQSRVMEILGIEPADVSTQIVPRDGLAQLVTSVAIFSSVLDLIGNEIRNLQRTEIAEVQEPFRSESQVGSSTMPHKRNPIMSEKVCGLARVIRGLALTSLENVVLEHERDLTNSSTERCMVPEVLLLFDEQLVTLTKVIRGLVINEDRIKENLAKFGEMATAERVMMELFKRGVGRQEAHELVRKAAMRAYESKKPFIDSLLEDENISKYFDKRELEELTDPTTYLGISAEIAKKEFDRAEEFIRGVSCG